MILIKSLNHSHFKREKNIVIECLSTGEEKPVLKLKQTFPDVEKLTELISEYTQKYCDTFPHLFERIDLNKNTENKQLSLF